MASIYLASPFGFSIATKPFLEELKASLRQAGYKVNDPWELGEKLATTAGVKAQKLPDTERRRFLHEVSRELGTINQQALDRSDLVIAALDGPDVDSGTASEIGYAFARGKKIVGLRSDFRLTGENEGVTVNLQVQYWIERSGGRIVRSLQELSKALASKNPKAA